jgi:hypothetical protein
MGATTPRTPMRDTGAHSVRGGACVGRAEPKVRAQTSARRSGATNTDPPPEACVGGRRKGEILLHVLPKRRGQQYRVRGDVQARLTRGLDAPMIIGLRLDAHLRPEATTARPHFHHTGCRRAASATDTNTFDTNTFPNSFPTTRGGAIFTCYRGLRCSLGSGGANRRHTSAVGTAKSRRHATHRSLSLDSAWQ